MPDTKITALTAIGANPIIPSTFPIPMVDLTDTSMAASGTTKKVTVNQILGAGGTATLASATITGDLTVDTSTLKVDSANNRVGIVNASPTRALDVVGSAIVSSEIRCSTFDTGTTSGDLYLFTSNRLSQTAAPTIECQNSSKPLIINHTGSQSMLFGIGSSLQMTLNSTGLGVGVSPGSAIGNLQVGGSSNANLYVQQGTDTIRMGVRASGRTGIILDSSNATYTNRAWYLDNVGSSGSLVIGRQGLDVITFDNSGNCGIGVTPSATDSTYYQALEIARVGQGLTCAKTAFTATPNSWLSNNSYATYSAGTVWKYAVSSQLAAQYRLAGGEHQWYNAPSGTAGNAITFTQAMTLTAAGELLVGKTASSSTVIGAELRPSGAIISTLAASTNADFALYTYSTGAGAARFYVGMSGTVFATNTTISAISDQRLKENVQDIDVGLGAILALKPRKFDWKEGKGKDIKGDRGFIAQEFEQVFPQLVDEWADPAPEGETPYKSVRQDLIPVLVKAIQELTARVQTLETR